MTDEAKTTPPAEKTAGKPALFQRLALGIALGAVIGFAMDEMGLGVVLFEVQHLLVIGTGLGIMLGFLNLRKTLWSLAIGLLIATLAVAYTPLAPALMRGMDRRDEMGPVDAVVVLGGGFVNSQVIGAQAQDRLLKGLELLRAGYAPRLVLTRPGKAGAVWPSQARDEMKKLRQDFPVDEVGPVQNTHDEALAVAELIHQRGWKRIILVTHWWHMRRAAATFGKTGVSILCSPCQDSTCDLVTYNDPSDHLTAFSDWLHENVGYCVYRFRGWL